MRKNERSRHAKQAGEEHESEDNGKFSGTKIMHEGSPVQDLNNYGGGMFGDVKGKYCMSYGGSFAFAAEFCAQNPGKVTMGSLHVAKSILQVFNEASAPCKSYSVTSRMLKIIHILESIQLSRRSRHARARRAVHDMLLIVSRVSS